MVRIRLSLENDEFRALLEAAQQDMRPTDLEIRWLLLQALEQRGLLPSNRGDNDEDPEE